MTILVALIPLLPLLGFIILGLGYRSIPKRVASILGPGTIMASFILSIIVLFNYLASPIPHPTFYHLAPWLSFSGFSVGFDFLIDPLSILMMLIITGVGFIIHVYSAGYMSHDEGFNRFFAYMNLFIFFMLILVMGANYAVMFIGWEGVGLCSYLLIGFWFKNQQFNNAAKKAFIMNRIGDLGFLMGMFLIFTTFRSFNYVNVFDQAKTMSPGSGTMIAITLLLFVGAVGKSAQIPLYTWLPDAMAGPTPVSALIHAATMVTAGVYMVARSSVLYVLAPETMDVIGVIALATMLLAAVIAIFQNDIKKVLAYSTISQLGYMFLALSVGAFTGAMFHLMTHAFFKALLFLGAGSVIHAMEGEQDIRKMGGLKNTLPRTYWTFLVGTLAIAGLPPFSGFFSKDEILAGVFSAGQSMWIIAVAVTLMTAFYMFRLLFLTFHGSYRGTGHPQSQLHESPSMMIIPLMILALLALAGGFLNIPELMGGKGILKEFLAPVFADAVKLNQAQHLLVPEKREWFNIVLVIFLVLLMAWMAYRKFGMQDAGSRKRETGNRNWDAGSRNVFIRWAENKFYVDELYDAVFVKPALKLSEGLHRFVEIRFIDRIVDGTGNTVIKFSSIIRYLQAGHVGVYMFFMIIGILLILFFNIIL
ncbi:MAG: NADH-quinone oxidoreductase subunit L [Bacteroidetes bacterium]|nr:NADH-quinone oxidoreductase subunit L [Bacteroidota bacterium]